MIPKLSAYLAASGMQNPSRQIYCAVGAVEDFGAFIFAFTATQLELYRFDAPLASLVPVTARVDAYVLIVGVSTALRQHHADQTTSYLSHMGAYVRARLASPSSADVFTPGVRAAVAWSKRFAVVHDIPLAVLAGFFPPFVLDHACASPIAYRRRARVARSTNSSSLKTTPKTRDLPRLARERHHHPSPHFRSSSARNCALKSSFASASSQSSSHCRPFPSPRPAPARSSHSRASNSSNSSSHSRSTDASRAGARAAASVDAIVVVVVARRDLRWDRRLRTVHTFSLLSTHTPRDGHIFDTSRPSQSTHAP